MRVQPEWRVTSPTTRANDTAIRSRDRADEALRAALEAHESLKVGDFDSPAKAAWHAQNWSLIRALQAQAHIDALHMLSYDLDAIRCAMPD